VKLKISRLWLEMTGVYLTGSSRPPPPLPTPNLGEGHLAVGVLADGAFAACVVSLSAYLAGRCIAVR